MMNNIQFSSINTKISAIRAKMLRKQDFIHIMNLDSVEEVIQYLNDHTDLKDVLWDLTGKKVHRNDIERRLFQYRRLILEKLRYYLGNEYKDFLKKYMIRYEIEDLKLIFEVVRGKKHLEDITNHPFRSSKYSKLNFAELLKQDSLLKVLKQLKGTDYYRLILPYIQNVDEKFSFYVEMVLDKYYYDQLIESAQNLPDSADKKSEEILRRNIDLYNLEWIYRATKYFDMSKEEILNFVLNGGYKYNYKKLKDLIYSFDLKDIEGQFQDSDYKFLFNRDQDIDLYMERRIDRYIYYKSLRLYRSSTLTFDKVITFMLLIEFEMKDIISIIESKRYHMTAKEISKYLIRKLEVN